MMKKYVCYFLLLVCACAFTGCKKQGQTEDPTPKYDMNATAEDEGVIEGENGALIVPSYSEEYGHSNGKIIVTTPEVDGCYDVLTYQFPYSTLQSIEYEMHLASEEQAQKIYDEKVAAGIPGVSIEGNIVRYSDVSSRWIGFKKRDILGNLSETWEKLGYTYVNE